jgi:hypothetical protein
MRDLNRQVSGEMGKVKEDGIKDGERATNDSANFKKEKLPGPGREEGCRGTLVW